MENMDQAFLIKLGLSFLVGSVWITSVTVIAERFGSKIGGFIGGLPSTVVVALIFIGLSESVDSASRAAGMIPLVMGVNSGFILVYLALVHRGLLKTLASALFLWFVVIAFIVWFQIESALVSFLVWSLSLGFAYYVTEHVMNIAHKGGIRLAYTTQQILARGIISGFIIASAVLISRLAGPVIGGIFSNFPIIFMSTLYITYRTGGEEFSRAVAKTLLLSGMINVGVFTFSAHFAYQHLSLLWGTVVAVLVSLLGAKITYNIVRRQIS